MGATTAITAAPSPVAAAGLPTIKVSMVPKLLGLAVFEANEQGALKVASKLGINFTYTAPATASAEGQVSIFKAEIAQHYDVITMSSDDPTVPAPVLQQAMKAGIQVVTYDSDVPTARDFFMQDTAYSGIGEALINAVEAFTGPKAEIAIMSSTPDATIQLAWIGAMKTYIAAKYSGLKLDTIGYGESIQSTSLTVAEGIIHSYPNVKSIICIDSAACVGTAEAIADLHESGKIGDFGIGPPKENRTYFANNSMQALFLWDEIGQGKLDMLMARLAYEGAHGAPECTATTPPANPTPSQWCGIKTNQKAPQYFSGAAVGLSATAGPGSTGMDNSFMVYSAPSAATGATANTVIYSAPLEFTKSNYLQYNF
ncbi:MAG TPA: substrate-binding domain-containing protein [Acidimicrobiales bacterium]|nr:substrate-binding domain-containing protein [Acidimicrobiales bacterium]